MLILKFWREILLGIAIAAAIFFYQYPFNCPAPEIKTVVKTEEKIVTKVVEKIKEIRPDGTVIEKEVTTDTKKNAKVSDKKTDKGSTSPTEKYSVGVSIKNLDYKDLLIDVGARLGDTPFEATAGYETKDKAFLLGIRVRF